MAPIRGWGEKGQRLQAFVPHGHWKTMTFLAALRVNGITAPCVFDGPINAVSFQRYVEQFLLPTLKQGDFVILDNLGSHKSEAVRNAIKSVGARLLFCRPTAPISTLLNKCSQSLSTSCVKQNRELSKQPGTASAHCSLRSNQTNAQTTLPARDMVPSK